ncbi:MAG: hypothetical protein LQ347_001719 [Umbilicaria vellea]|nr:MAG: hypothetical protein LQ347_001719 [Umbilicaria vellea]
MVLGLWLPVFVAASSVAVSSAPWVLVGSLVTVFSPLVSAAALPTFPVALEKRTLEKRTLGFNWPRIISGRGESKSPKNTQHNGISEELLAKFNLYAGYAAAAYCADNNDSPGTQVTCPVGNCELVEAANATTISEFENTIKTDDTGFVAIDDQHKVIVLAFRGSRSTKNWLANFNWAKKSTDLCDGLVPKVLEAVHMHPDYSLVVTGHSLGAAVATLAAANLRKLDSHLANVTELYTFGSPRVGDETTAEFLTSQSDKSYRITAGNDPVARIPGVIVGYKHMSPEYWISNNPNSPGTQDFVVLAGTYNKGGNSGKHGIQVATHRHYFGPITQCLSSEDEGGKRALSGG